MKKYKALLLKYIILKDDILFKKTGVHCFALDDINEIIYDWLEDVDCKKVLDSMRKHKQGLLSLGSEQIRQNEDGKFCPWCILIAECTNCNYSIRHGCCNNYNSTYKNIAVKLKSSEVFVINVPEIRNLTLDILDEYEKIK